MDLVPLKVQFLYPDKSDIQKPLDDKLMDHHRLGYRMYDHQAGYLYGNYNSLFFPFLYEHRFSYELNLGRTHSRFYSFREDNIPHLLVNKPISELDFVFFGNGNEEFRGILSQNLSRKWHIGAGIRRSNNKGAFLQQENVNNNLYLTSILNLGRVRSSLDFHYNDLKSNENGGTIVSVYDSLAPNTWINAQPTLKSAKHEMKEFRVTLRNRILLWPEQIKDSIRVDTFVMQPRTSPLYLDFKTDYGAERQIYHDASQTSFNRSFYGDFGNDSNYSELYSKTSLFRLQHTSNLTYRLKNDFILTGYHRMASEQIEHKSQNDSSILSNSFLNTGIGGKLEMLTPGDFQLRGEIYKSISGYTQNDFLIQGEIEKQLYLFNLIWKSSYSRQLPAYINSYISYNQKLRSYELNTQNVFENSLFLMSDKLKLKASASSFIIEDFLTYDLQSNPIQISNNIFQASLEKEWGFGVFYFPTSIYFQNSIFPSTFLRQTLAYRKQLFSRHLNLILGTELTYNLTQKAMPYQPLWMDRLYDPNALDARQYAKMDLFVSARIHRVQVSLMFDNLSSSFFNSGTSYLKNAPINPNTFYFRMTWLFSE